MQTHLYLAETYLFEIDTTIAAQGHDEQGYWVALKENIFHPQGGGQPADESKINGHSVKIVKQPTGLVVAYLLNETTFDTGSQVHAVIDSDKRRHHAALHTAGHLLNWELRRFGWLAQKGHHFPDESRVEFSMMSPEAIPADQLDSQHIESIVNQSIQSGRRVSTVQQDGTRISYIDATEEMPCGGTHVAALNQISNFSIKSMKYKKGILRISYDAKHCDIE